MCHGKLPGQRQDRWFNCGLVSPVGSRSALLLRLDRAVRLKAIAVYGIL